MLQIKTGAFCLMLMAAVALAAEEQETRTLRLVQDDAQDRMVSKIYTLKYTQSNDILPFLLGAIKRYNINSSANCIEYGNNNQQFLTVTCPVKMMPDVDDFIRKADMQVRVVSAMRAVSSVVHIKDFIPQEKVQELLAFILENSHYITDGFDY